MRTRSEFSNHAACVITDIFPVSGTSSTSTQSLGKAYERTTVDTVVPNFRARSANGEVFNNDFSTTAVWTSYSGVYHGETWAEHNYVWKAVGIRDYTLPSNTFASFTSPFSNTPNYAGVAGNKALSGVNATKANLPLFVAEWSKTRVLFNQIGELLVKSMKNGRALVRNGKVKRYLPATSKNLANAWLIERFAVTPLLYELQGATELLSKIRPLRNTARGNESYTTSASSVYNIPDSGGTWHVTKSSSLELAWRNGILYENSNHSYGSEAASIGITRPATVLWELLPWTFVLDRFVDIGTWLDAIQPDGAAKYLAAWSGLKSTLSITCSVSGFTPNSTYGVTNRNYLNTWSATRVVITKERHPWAASASFPTWNPYFNPKHLGDYAALVRQRIRLGA